VSRVAELLFPLAFFADKASPWFVPDQPAAPSQQSSGKDCSMKGSAIAAQFGNDEGTRWPSDRDKATMLGKPVQLGDQLRCIRDLAAARLPASCGRLSRAAIGPFATSNSTNSASDRQRLVAQNADLSLASIRDRIAAAAGLRSQVGNRRVHTNCTHRMPFGRSAIESNVIAVFMLQQRRRRPTLRCRSATCAAK